ncbi:hypothetical protein SAMN02927937_01527 [Paenimyroides aquimaris]|uniref:Uncharacterized protein n=1 Tax=Paenimyroides marinum TaxID=1159016 RepID=A0A1H6L3R7_9FLAO|nr:hypothetical protein [Paenimyroides aquimaris]SEH80537.1 hypothetical protein SAMN02927937_01527 [Paenimyroides aquimaris]
MRIIKSLIFIPIILTLNSCFLAITGAPHFHSYKEINNKNDLKLDVHCMYLNKTFEIRNTNPSDSIYIQSLSFKKPNERKSLNHNNFSDSVRFYNWRIGDMKYHNKKREDTIQIIQVTNNGKQNIYKYILELNNGKNRKNCNYS